MNKLTFIIVAIIIATNTHARKLVNKDKNVFIGQKVVHLFDNATVGAIQTIIGATHIGWYMIFDRNGPEMKLYNDPNSEVIQVSIENPPPFFGGAYSLGLFQVGGYAQGHEGGHSVASAALGPAYLPTVALSYLAESHGGSFMETWADIEGYSDEGYEWMRQLKVGRSTMKAEGKEFDVVSFQLSLDQVQNMKGGNLEIEKVYHWLNTNVILPIASNNSNIEDIPIFEIDLLKKEVNVVIDNIGVYLGRDQHLRWQVKTTQEYLHYEKNSILNLIHKKAASWQTSYGLVYNMGDKLKIEANAGIGIAYESIELEKFNKQAQGFSFGTKFDLSITLKEKYKATYSKEYWNINSNLKYEKSFSGFEYAPKKSPFTFLNKKSKLKLSIGAYENKYQYNDLSIKEKSVGASLSISF